MTARLIFTGIASYVPGVGRFTVRHANTTGRSAGYCYRVWHRHLLAYMNSGSGNFPETVVELGPGGSLGVGLCALLMGARRYIGLDAVSRPVFPLPDGFLDELERMVSDCAPVSVPSWISAKDGICDPAILKTARWRDQIAPARVRERRNHLEKWLEEGSPRIEHKPITYLAPWDKDTVLRALGDQRANLVLSHSVLQYITDLVELSSVLKSFTAPGGRITHHVDLGSMKSLTRWNEYWTYSNLRWRLMEGRRPYFPTRLPLSSHLEALKMAGLRIATAVVHTRPSGLEKKDLHRDWKHLSTSDISGSAYFAVCSVE